MISSALILCHLSGNLKQNMSKLQQRFLEVSLEFCSCFFNNHSPFLSFPSNLVIKGKQSVPIGECEVIKLQLTAAIRPMLLNR